MAQVTVKFYGLLGRRDVDLEERIEVPAETTVRGLVERFIERHAEPSGERPGSPGFWETHVVMLNGRHVDEEKQLTTTLGQGDNVTIFLPVSGG